MPQLHDFHSHGARSPIRDGLSGLRRCRRAPQMPRSLSPFDALSASGAVFGRDNLLDVETSADEIRLRFRYRDERVRDYLRSYGLDPVKCRGNSFGFIGELIQTIVCDFDNEHFEPRWEGATVRSCSPSATTTGLPTTG